MKKLLKWLGFRKIEPGRYSRLAAYGHCRGEDYRPGMFSGIEWAWKFKDPQIGFWREADAGYDHGTVYLGLLVVNVYVQFVPWGPEGHRTGWNLSKDHWQRWKDVCPMNGDYTFVSWRDRLWDFLFGKTVCGVQKGRQGSGVVQMPEGGYKCKWHYETRVWLRPRWPFHKIRKATVCDCDGGIPFQGKGENSWDCGDDSLHGWGNEGHDADAAMAKGREIVLRERARFGEPSFYCPDAEGDAD